MVSLVRNGLIDLHDRSLPMVEILQTSFPDNKNTMINISALFDPRYVFLFYAPILFAINRRVGHRLIIALTATEWCNQILKWLLAGDRPYWYVHERAIETALSASNKPMAANFTTGIDSYDMAVLLNGAHQQLQPLASFKQFPVTCEMGAGSPSGHAMVTATVWYILIDAYLKGELVLFGQSPISNLQAEKRQPAISHLSKLTWSLYAFILILVSLSRVYLACHFPHQCLCGAILGVMVAKLVQRIPLQKLSKLHFCAATIFMCATAMGTYAILRALGVDPLWTVTKAMRWCAKKEYIMLDTTPFFSMIRYLAFCLGAGLAFDPSKLGSSSSTQDHDHLTNKIPSKTATTSAYDNRDEHLLFLRRIIGAFSAVMFGQFLLSMPISKSNIAVFYLISFLMYTLMSYSFAGPIPRLVKRSITSLATNQKLKTT